MQRAPATGASVKLFITIFRHYYYNNFEGEKSNGWLTAWLDPWKLNKSVSKCLKEDERSAIKIKTVSWMKWTW